MSISVRAPRRAVATALAGAAAISGLMLTAPVAQAAAPGTTTATLTVRAGTNSSTAALTTIPSGTTISLQCQTKGQAVEGTSNSDWWAKVTYGGKTGYVSRAYVKVTDATGLTECGKTTTPPPAKSVVNGPISRTEVLARAQFWVSKKVPYSQSQTDPDPAGKLYRQDCSGLASMALHLDKSYSTMDLQAGGRMKAIAKNDLKPGDLVGNLGRPAGQPGHVVVFKAWANTAKTKFVTLEETPGFAQSKTRDWGTSYWNKQAWRYTKITG